MGNVGLIAGLYTQDYDLIGRSLHDEIVEPLRSVLIPGFDLIKKNGYGKRCVRFWNIRIILFSL
jgi:homoserine kinase